MSSVGPQLPPHLTKRKRSIDDDAEDSKSPPFKVQAASAPRDQDKRILGATPPPPTTSNPDALDIDSSSEGGYGPSAASGKPTTAPPKRVVGPALPPGKNPDELDVDNSSSSDDDYGPALSKARSPTDKPSVPPPTRRVLGHAPPPAPLSELPPRPADADANASASSDSEDDYGPSLPPAPGSGAAAKAQYEQEQAQQQELLRESEPAKPQRDEWMLLPPSDSDWSSRVDPTKLKNRKFASGKSAKGAPSGGGGGGISSLWTETPEEKRKRLADEVLGRVDLSTSASSSTGNGGRSESREDEETARRIREYNERNRGKSLAEQRKRDGGQKEEEDDPSKREFDREKDMALGGRVGHVQKRELLAKAADFGSRFQKGRYL